MQSARSKRPPKSSLSKPPKKKKKIPASLAPSTGYWLIKAEPETRIVKGVDVKFSIDDLETSPNKTDHWDGVRNAEAKNHMTVMQVGDLCLYYHSNCKTPGVAGIARVVKPAYVDFTAFDKNHPYFDPKSNPEKPKWYMVDVQHVLTFDNFVPLSDIKSNPKLSNMQLVRRGRLSVQRVQPHEFEEILTCAKVDIDKVQNLSLKNEVNTTKS